MAGSVKVWLNNNAPQCADDDLNGFKLENNNLIEAAGIVLDDADHQQTNLAVAHYAAGGDFYGESGAANAYVLAAGGTRTAPPVYFTGMRVRFTATNDNTGASTVNVAGLGVKDITPQIFPFDRLDAGVISGYTELVYNGTTFDIVAAVEPAPVWGMGAITGDDFALGAVGGLSICALNSNTVAYIDTTNDELRAYRFGGSTWTLIGSGLAVAGVGGNVTLVALSDTEVALYDDVNDELGTFSFNGSTWSTVGNKLSIVTTSHAMCALNATDITFINSAGTIQAYRFDGTDWATLGNTLASGGPFASGLVALNGTDVAYQFTAGTELLTMYRFDGTDWAILGTPLTVTGVVEVKLAALNNTDIVMIDGDGTSTEPSRMRVFRFNSDETWAQVGAETWTPTNSDNDDVCALSGNDIAVVDTQSQTLRLYRFGYTLKALPYTRQLTS